MHRRFQWALRFGLFSPIVILFFLGLFGTASQAQAMQGSGAGLVFDLYPANKEVAYGCVRKPIRGWFTVSTSGETSISNPLAPLVPSQVQVWTTPPLVGTLSNDSWTIKSSPVTKRFTYTPTKTGDEHLTFHAMIFDSPNSPLAKNMDLTVIQCRFKVTVHGEFQNRQGSINSNIFYDGEGYLELVQNDGDTGWTLKGRGTTKLEEYVDGTEGDVTCQTTSPGKGAGIFYVEGDAVPSVRLNPIFRFTDILTSVGQVCTDKGKGKTMGNSIPLTGWLPNSAGSGVLWDLEFPGQGGSLDLPISAVDDTRWVTGGSIGSMQITITPETNP